nr:HTH-type transcriptional regulator HdfR [Shigella sp. FC1139]
MDTELLKTFLEVSRTRHFGRAAESLYLTQSAVSFRIRQLENQLGVNLFTRHRNNIRLTAAGEKLLPYAETLMSTWQAARKEVAHTSRHNEFSIGASASLWECMLNQWLGRLYQNQDAHTGLQFEARIAQRQSLVKQLHERQLDLLITTEAPKMDEFRGLMLNRTKTHVRREKPSKKSTNGRWCPFCANLRLKRHRFEGVFQCPLYFDLSDKKLLTCETVRLSVKPQFSSQLLGYFTLALYTSAPSKLKGDLNYLRLEWGPDFQQHEAGLIGADEVPILTTSSAELAQQQIAMLNGCTWLPVSWARKKGGLHTVVDSTTLSRPLYAIWLQNSDKNALIRDLLKINVLDEVY